MSSAEKKRVREAFRTAVFERDGYRCKGCRAPGTGETLDAHHITDRNLMPNGGYVKENGISLCSTCHEKAEVFHSTGQSLTNWAPDDLYRLIGSTHEAAVRASRRLD